LEWVSQNQNKIYKTFVIGGAKVYQEALSPTFAPYCTTLHITEVEVGSSSILCDTFFPEMDPSLFEIKETSNLRFENGYFFRYLTLKPVEKDNFPSLNQTSKINLILKSIDTIASVYLNGKFIAFVNNEFLKYQVESVNKYLLDGDNLLELKFFSAPNQASSLASVYPYYEPQECPPDVQHGICHANFLRKQQCSFSWDWGLFFYLNTQS
jgi:hypothetical protein